MVVFLIKSMVVVLKEPHPIPNLGIVPVHPIKRKQIIRTAGWALSYGDCILLIHCDYEPAIPAPKMTIDFIFNKLIFNSR